LERRTSCAIFWTPPKSLSPIERLKLFPSRCSGNCSISTSSRSEDPPNRFLFQMSKARRSTTSPKSSYKDALTQSPPSSSRASTTHNPPNEHSEILRKLQIHILSATDMDRRTYSAGLASAPSRILIIRRSSSDDHPAADLSASRVFKQALQRVNLQNLKNEHLYFYLESSTSTKARFRADLQHLSSLPYRTELPGWIIICDQTPPRALSHVLGFFALPSTSQGRPSTDSLNSLYDVLRPHNIGIDVARAQQELPESYAIFSLRVKPESCQAERTSILRLLRLHSSAAATSLTSLLKLLNPSTPASSPKEAPLIPALRISGIQEASKPHLNSSDFPNMLLRHEGQPSQLVLYTTMQAPEGIPPSSSIPFYISGSGICTANLSHLPRDAPLKLSALQPSASPTTSTNPVSSAKAQTKRTPPTSGGAQPLPPAATDINTLLQNSEISQELLLKLHNAIDQLLRSPTGRPSSSPPSESPARSTAPSIDDSGISLAHSHSDSQASSVLLSPHESDVEYSPHSLAGNLNPRNIGHTYRLPVHLPDTPPNLSRSDQQDPAHNGTSLSPDQTTLSNFFPVRPPAAPAEDTTQKQSSTSNTRSRRPSTTPPPSGKKLRSGRRLTRKTDNPKPQPKHPQIPMSSEEDDTPPEQLLRRQAQILLQRDRPLPASLLQAVTNDWD